MARFGAGHMPPPQYDLEAERNLLPETKCSDAQWGEVNDLIPLSATLPQTSPLPLIGAPIDGKQFRYSRRIMAGDPGLSAVTLDAAVLAHSDLDDLRIADSSGRQVPYLLEKRDEPLVLKLKIHKRISGRKDRTSNYLSTYKVDLQFDSLPSCRLVLSTVARVFDRMVTINAERTSEDRRAESRVETLASARWRHLAEDRADPLLVLDLAELLTSQLTISIDEGDNSPLPIKSIQLLFPSYRLRFFHGAGASLTLYYGAPSLSRPRYDLALLAPRLTGAAAHELSLSPETILSPATSAAPLQKRLFWGMLIVATVVLLFLLVRLLLSGVKPPEQPQSR